MCSYPIGRGRPPVRTRFKPGKSGNPAGRPKRLPPVGRVIHAELTEVVSVAGRKMRKIDAVVHALVQQAIAGNLRATAVLFAALARTPEPRDEAAEELSDADREILEKFANGERVKAAESETAQNAPKQEARQ
jgi:hypothetical protein